MLKYVRSSPNSACNSYSIQEPFFNHGKQDQDGNTEMRRKSEQHIEACVSVAMFNHKLLITWSTESGCIAVHISTTY